jgi:hypothetical protein
MKVPRARWFTNIDGLQFFWKYVDYATQRTPRNRMYLTWMSQVTHWGLPTNPEWAEKGYQHFIQDETVYDTVDAYLNGIRETDDNVKSIIEGFRQRGLEDETLFIMFVLFEFADKVMATTASHLLEIGSLPSIIHITILIGLHS